MTDDIYEWDGEGPWPRDRLHVHLKGSCVKRRNAPQCKYVPKGERA